MKTIDMTTQNSRQLLIDTIDSPRDLKKHSKDSLPKLATEIREILIEEVTKHGGHLASNLGTVEMTLALHYCFDAPQDKIVWDVGHQAYTHKLLTGRRERFSTLRSYQGISGFPNVHESEYDAFSVGHASTSISAALGMAKARDLSGESHKVVSIIGDGALTGGLAWEGLNNLGNSSTQMAVILNDNRMSISKNVGALSRYLTTILTDKRYNKMKDNIWELLGHVPNAGKRIRNLVHNIDDSVKHFLIPGKLFHDIGLRYFGPIDGHDVNQLIDMFQFIKENANYPVLIHTITTKGKGYRHAENNATKYHGVSRTEFCDNNKKYQAKENAPKYCEVMGTTLTEIARERNDVVAITAAMPDGTGLIHFADIHPDRFFDVGIAEGHAVTFAAGLASCGKKPVVAIYSTFLQRTYDQLIHDVALDKRNVVFCVDRAGVVGDDGPTHHGAFDLSFLRTIPNAVIMAPRDEVELQTMLYTAMEYDQGPVFIRYPRGKGTGRCPSDATKKPLRLYKPETLHRGSGVALLSAGHCYKTAKEAIALLKENGFDPTFVNARFVKPIDEKYYDDILATHDYVVTLEFNTIKGGWGSEILEHASASHLLPPRRILTLGYPDSFITHGDPEILHNNTGLDPSGIAERIQRFISEQAERS